MFKEFDSSPGCVLAVGPDNHSGQVDNDVHLPGWTRGGKMKAGITLHSVQTRVIILRWALVLFLSIHN